MIRRSHALAFGSATLLVARLASGADPPVIDVPDDVSMDLRPVAPCVVFPSSMRNAASCNGLPVDSIAPATAGERNEVLAQGVLRLHEGALADLSIWRFTGKPRQPLSNDDGDRVVERIAEFVRRSLPGNVVTHASKGRFVDTAEGARGAKWKAVRGAVEIEVPAQPIRFHVAALWVATGGDGYMVIVTGRAADASDVDKALDAITSHTRVKRPAIGGDAGEALGAATADLLITFFKYGILAGVAMAVVMIQRHWAKRKKSAPPPSMR